MVNIGRNLSERIRAAQPGDGIRERAIEYLKQNDLTSKSLRSDKKFVFIDAQYVGSIFDSILEILGTSREQMGDRLTGYLVMRADEESLYDELGWLVQPIGENYFELFFNVFGQEWGKGALGASMVYGYKDLPTYSTQKKMNWALGGYLQIQPKFARSGFDIEYIDGEWRVLVAEEDRGYPITRFADYEPTDVTQPITHPNSDPVDPVAATKLQIMTVNYFSDPVRRERLLENISLDEITENMREVDEGSSRILLSKGIDIEKERIDADQDKKDDVVFRFMQILELLLTIKDDQFLSYGQSKRQIEGDDFLILMIFGNLNNHFLKFIKN